jgi:hypothetical protein
MSDWTHTVCEECYQQLEPGREPVRVVVPSKETCCRCGETTDDGIYYRDNPKSYRHCNHEEG